MNKQDLLDLGFQFEKAGSICGQDMWAGMDIWRLPYANRTKSLVFRGNADRLHYCEDYNTELTDIEQVKYFVFKTIRKVI